MSDDEAKKKLDEEKLAELKKKLHKNYAKEQKKKDTHSIKTINKPLPESKKRGGATTLLQSSISKSSSNSRAVQAKQPTSSKQRLEKALDKMKKGKH